MKLNKTQGNFLRGVIERWEAEGTVTTDTANRLKTSYTVRSFEWKELAKYSFWIAIVCAVVAVGSVLADRLIMEFLQKLFLSSYSLASGFFALLAALTYYWGWRRRQRLPYKIFSNETILFLGVVLTAVSIGYLGAAIDTGSGHYSVAFAGDVRVRFSGASVLVFHGVGVCPTLFWRMVWCGNGVSDGLGTLLLGNELSGSLRGVRCGNPVVPLPVTGETLVCGGEFRYLCGRDALLLYSLVAAFHIRGFKQFFQLV